MVIWTFPLLFSQTNASWVSIFQLYFGAKFQTEIQNDISCKEVEIWYGYSLFREKDSNAYLNGNMTEDFSLKALVGLSADVRNN